MTSGPVWLLRSVVEAMHGEQIAEHGGAEGLRDEGVARLRPASPGTPARLWRSRHFRSGGGLRRGIARNHPLFYGNKRTSLLAAYIFLRLNGQRLAASQDEAVDAVLRLATGELAESVFPDWLRAKGKAG